MDWNLIQQLGYLATFFGCLFEGEITLMTSAFLAAQGEFNIWAIAILGGLGVYLADNWWFYVGKRFGTRFIHAHRHLERRAAFVQRMLERNKHLVIFIYRYAWGFRTITPVVLGTTHISRLRFAVYTLFTSALWSAIFTNIGYRVGERLVAIIAYVRSIEIAIFTIVAIILTVVIYRKFEPHIKQNVHRSVELSRHVGKRLHSHIRTHADRTRRRVIHLRELHAQRLRQLGTKRRRMRR